jgi:hypothetical protein
MGLERLRSLFSSNQETSMTRGRSLFSPLPPAFAKVPPYLVHITVHSWTSQNRTSGFPIDPASQSTNRGDLHSSGVSRVIVRPLQLFGPHHSRRGHSTTSFYIGRRMQVLPLRLTKPYLGGLDPLIPLTHKGNFSVGFSIKSRSYQALERGTGKRQSGKGRSKGETCL